MLAFQPAFRAITIGTPVFTIGSLFLNGEQGAWYDPSDITTLFQDSAGSTPVTAAGQPVGLMLDKSGRGNHARQTTAAARPLYQIDAGKPYLAFDGVDDFMVTTAFAWGSDEAFLSEAVTRSASGIIVLSEFSANANNFAGSFYHVLSDSVFNASSRGSASISNGLAQAGAIIFNAPSVVLSTHKISSDFSRIRKNGVAGTDATGDQGSGNFGTYPLHIGARSGGVGSLNGRIYGAIYRNLNPNPTTIAAIEQYLAAKSGATLA